MSEPVHAADGPDEDPLDLAEHERTGAGLLVAAAAVTGCAAVLAFTWIEASGLRLLLALGVVLAGAIVLAGTRNGPAVRQGTGAAVVLLGTYLVGTALALLVATGDDVEVAPSPTVLVLLIYGLPLLALVALALRGIRAGVVGTGLVLVTVVVTVCTVQEVPTGTIAVLTLVLAAVGLVLTAVLRSAPAADLATAAGALAATYAVGAGSAPFDTLAQVSRGLGTDRGLPATTNLVTALGLVVAAALAGLAVRRRDAAGATVAGLAFAAPPAALAVRVFANGEDGGAVVPLLAAPALVLLLAVAGLAVAERVRIGRPVLLAAAGTACLAAATLALPLLVHWPAPVRGVVGLVVLLGAAVLAWRLPGAPGAVLAGLTVVATQLLEPARLLLTEISDGPLLPGLAGLLVAVVIAVPLLHRHRHPGVVAAATYLFAGVLAVVLLGVLGGGSPGLLALVQFAPLVLLGAVAAVLALTARSPLGRAAGQAAGAVVLAAGGCAVLITLLLSVSGAATRDVLTAALDPLAPTSAARPPQLIYEPTPAPTWWTAALLVVTAALLVSTGYRRSAPLAAAAGFVVLVAGEFGAITALDARHTGAPPSQLATLVAVLVAAVVCALAGAVLRSRRAGAEPVPR